MLRKRAIIIKGVSGSAVTDAYGWRRTIASNNLGTSRKDLHKEYANVEQKSCPDPVEAHTIDAFLSCYFMIKVQDFDPVEWVKMYEELLVKSLFQVCK